MKPFATESSDVILMLVEQGGQTKKMQIDELIDFTQEEDKPILESIKNEAGSLPRFGIYYNQLQTIEGLNDTALAADYIGDNFDVMVLHYGLEDPNTIGNAEMKTIVADVMQRRPDFKFYGYIHTGTTVEPSFTVDQLKITIDRWLAAGCYGVFFDECEYAFGTTRQRLNALLDYLHEKGGYAIVNSWDHTDLYDDSVSINNPTGETLRMLETDALHHESLCFNNEQPDYQGTTAGAAGSNGLIHVAFLQAHEAPTLLARKKFKCGYYAINTYDSASSADTINRAFSAVQTVAAIYGLNGVGLTVKDFGASGGGQYKCPAFTYKTWKATYAPDVKYNGTRVSRGELVYASELDKQYWSSKRAVLKANVTRTDSTIKGDQYLVLPYKKGTTAFFARLMPFGNSGTPVVNLAIEAQASFNDGQTSELAFGTAADNTVRTVNQGWDSTIWSTGLTFNVPVYGRKQIEVRGSFVAASDGYLRIKWAPTAGQEIIMTTGSMLEIIDETD